MSEQTLSQILTSVQFINAPDGRRLAVLDADDWAGLIDWLENTEDHRVIQAASERLRAGPEASGALPLETTLDEP